MGKNQTAVRKSYAEEGLEDVQNEFNAAETALQETNNGTNEEEFVQVGGLEPVAFYYRTSAPKKPTKSAFKIINKGQTINGTYERAFKGGKFNNTTYLIRENGQLVGLPGAAGLSRAMDKLEIGSKVQITYNGMEEIKSGEWAGRDAHTFIVRGNKLKQQ
jgi:hypothetical protein